MSSLSKNPFAKYILNFFDGASTPSFLVINPWLNKVDFWPVLKLKSADTFLDGTSIVLTIAWTFEFSNLTDSPSTNSLSFVEMYDIWASVNCSVNIAIAPDVVPVICSPNSKSVVPPSTVLIDDNVIFGDEGSLVSVDSNTPKTSNTSGVFKDIFSSWTRVPNG